MPMMTTPYKTRQDVLEWVEELPDDVRLCPYCLTEMVEAEGEIGMVVYCPNEMCLSELEYVIP